MNKVLSVFRVMAVILICPLVLLTVLSSVIKWVVLSPNTYTSFVNDAFADSLTDLVRGELEAECLFYDLPFEVLDKPLSRENIGAYARQYAETMCDTLINGEMFEAPSVDSSVYVVSIQSFFDSLEETKRPLDPKAAQTLGEELALVAQAELKAGLDDAWLQKAHRVLSHRLLLLSADAWYLLIVFTLTIGTTAVLLDRRRIIQRFYGVSFSAAIGAALAAVPLQLLCNYGFPERLALMDSPLKLYIDGVLSTLIANAALLSLAVASVLALLLLAAIVACVLPKKE